MASVRRNTSFGTCSTSYERSNRTTFREDISTATSSRGQAQDVESLTSRSHPITGNGRRPKTRAKTTTTAYLGSGDQEIICAITESRGISPTIGLAFVNLSTTEAVMCQIADSQTYVKTLHKLAVFEPSQILMPVTSFQPIKSKLCTIMELNVSGVPITAIDRKYWAEDTGMDYIQKYAFRDHVEAIKVSVGGNFYATCCLAAVCVGSKYFLVFLLTLR
jgi:DNA mismatch repair protein MSH4